MDADQPPNLVEVSGQHQEKTAALEELSGPVIPGIRPNDAIGARSVDTARPQESWQLPSLFEIDSIRG